MDTLRAKKQLFFLPPSQNLLRAGHVPVGCISFKLAQWLPRPLAGNSRAPSQLARRDALSLTVSAPRLSDFLSNNRSGDAADWQVACGSMLWQRRFVSSLELRRARPADGDTSAVCGPRASAMRPRRVAVGYRPRERSANDARYGCSTVYHHSGCGCESGSARP